MGKRVSASQRRKANELMITGKVQVPHGDKMLEFHVTNDQFRNIFTAVCCALAKLGNAEVTEVLETFGVTLMANDGTVLLKGRESIPLTPEVDADAPEKETKGE